MKVEVKDKVSAIAYPCLMKSKNNGQVVLFTSIESGIVIQKNNSCNKEFEYIDVFKDLHDSDVWVKFDGEITLKND